MNKLFKNNLTKIILALVCLVSFALGMVLLDLNVKTQTTVAQTGGASAMGATYEITQSDWKGAKTKNIIVTPSLPSYNTGDGKDMSKWKSNWNKVMAPSGWGSSNISGDDDALQVYATDSINGTATFAIRPVKSGAFSGGDACLGTVVDHWTVVWADLKGGISYTVGLSANDQARANDGKLRTTYKAEFYRQSVYAYAFGLTAEFYDVSGQLIKKESDSWSALGNSAGFLARGTSGVAVPSGTAYIRYWFTNYGDGNSRKSIKNMQAYLINDAHETHDAHDDATFNTAWSSSTSLPTTAGNYFLTKDVTITSTYSPVDGVNLCLNGYKIIANADVTTVELASGRTFNVYDCTEAGEITHASGKSGKGVESSGTFNFYGGKITGNGSESMDTRGGGVLLLNGTFNMYGGEITENKVGGVRGGGVSVGNTSTDKANIIFNMYGGEIYGNTVGGARGSAVSVGGATTGGDYLFYFNMYGGKIYGNTTHHDSGAADAVIVDKNGRFIMKGGEVTENRNGVYVEAGVITISGTAKITANADVDGKSGRNLRLGVSDKESRYLTIGEGGLTEGAKIGISLDGERDKQISSGTKYTNNPDYSSTATLSYIYSEDNTQMLYYSSETKAIMLDNGHAHADTKYNLLTTTSGALSSGNYYLDGDVNATGSLTIPNSAVVTLCLNGHTLNMGEWSIVNEIGGTFKTCDCMVTGVQNMGEITGDGTIIENNGELSMDSVNVKSTGYSAKPAISNNANGRLNMRDGEITSSSGTTIANSGTVEADESVALEGSVGDETPPHVHEFEDNNCYCGAHTHDEGTTLLTEWTTTSGTITTSGTYYLSSDITATGSITMGDGTNDCEITLCLNGFTLDMGAYYMINNGTLNICDCSDAQGTIQSSSSYVLWNKGKLNIGGATLINSNVNGYAIYGDTNSDITITKCKMTAAFETIRLDNGTCLINPEKDSDVECGAKENAIRVRGSDVGLNIYGGTFTSENNFAVIVGFDNSKGVNINGGIFETKSNSASAVRALGALNINGGKFISNGGKALDINANSGSDLYKTKVTIAGNVPLSDGIKFTGSSIGKNYAGEYILDIGGYTGEAISATIDNAITLSDGALLYKGSVDKMTLTNSGWGLKAGATASEVVLHKHDYSTVKYDDTNHWNECSCGLVDSTSVKTHSIVNTDTDCTTDEKCSCGKVIVAKNEYHSYTYSASDNIITETCSVEGCTVHTATATISAPTGTLIYDGSTEFNATVDYSSAWAGGTLMISYTREGDIISAGEITASIMIGGKTASVTYTIAKANRTAPTGVSTVDTSYVDTTDGKITGVTNAMEYKLSTASDYVAISETEITDLASGTYYVRFKETDNYNASNYVSVTINKGGKRTATITNISDIGKTYNGTAVSNPTFAYGGDGQIAITWYADNGGVKGNALASAPLSAGTYWVGVKAGEGDIYNAVNEETKQFTIGKATYDMDGITFDNGVFTYSGNANSIYISGDLPTGVSVDYTNNGVINATTEPITVTATFIGDSTNYNAIPNKTATITINPKNISGANITLGSALTYTGEEQTQTVASVVIDGLTVTYDISGNKQTNVGASDYTLTVTGKGNFTGTANTAWNIAKAQVEILVDTTPIVKTYGETWELPQATSNFGSPVANLTVLQMKDADTYTLTFTVEATSNYLGDTESISVTINKAKVNKPAEDTTVFTYTGLEQTYTVVENTLYTIDGTTRTIAGSQNVTISLKDKDNYEWSDENTADVIYSFVIGKANAVITVDTTPIVKTYGDVWTLPVASTNFGTVICDKVIGDLVNANTYTVTYNVEGSANYNGDIKRVSVTIVKATLNMSAITFVDSTVNYNGSAQSILISGNLPTGVTVEYDGNGKVDAGIYTITANFIYDTANYNVIEPMTATLTINQDKVIDHIGETTTEKPNVEVTIEGGFAPDIEIIITELPAKDNKVEEVINTFDKVGAVYDITMESDGVAVQPSGEITIKLLIPENMKGKDFRIYHNHNGEFSLVEYTVEGDYAVFSVDKLSEFSFVYYEFPWWIVILAVVVIAGGVTLGIILNKNKKQKKAN